jgi:hypothetical protein
MAEQQFEFEGKQFEKPAEDIHDGMLYRVDDLGVQQYEYKGQKKSSRFVEFWYLLGTKDSDGAQFLMRERFTVSYTENSLLPKRLANFGITTQGFNRSDVERKTGRIMVTHTIKNGKTYANIAKFTPNPNVTVSIPADIDAEITRRNTKKEAKGVAAPANAAEYASA